MPNGPTPEHSAAVDMAKSRLDQSGGFATIATVTRQQVQAAFDDLRDAWREDLMEAALAFPEGPDTLRARTQWVPLDGEVGPAVSKGTIFTFEVDYPEKMNSDNTVVVSEYVGGSFLPPVGENNAHDYSFVTPYTTVHPQEHGTIVRISVVFPDGCMILEGDGVQLIFHPTAPSQ